MVNLVAYEDSLGKFLIEYHNRLRFEKEPEWTRWKKIKIYTFCLIFLLLSSCIVSLFWMDIDEGKKQTALIPLLMAISLLFLVIKRLTYRRSYVQPEICELRRKAEVILTSLTSIVGKEEQEIIYGFLEQINTRRTGAARWYLGQFEDYSNLVNWEHLADMKEICAYINAHEY